MAQPVAGQPAESEGPPLFTRCPPASGEKSLLWSFRSTDRLPGGARPEYHLIVVSGLSTAPGFG